MNNKNNWLLLLPVLAVYIIGMFNDVMEPDAAQYALMSLEMLDTGNFIELYHRGQDYIDKPPLIFWTAALSFKLFGVSNFAYKLPSVLFMLLGLYATYRLARKIYNEKTGFYSVLILASCQAWFMMNQDVKTDNLLVSCTVLAIWQLVEFNQNKKLIHIVIASLGIGGAMLTKGPIGLMVPLMALGTEFILKRSWKDFFQWQWLLLIVLVAICLTPMLIGLYRQFDSSEGKMTYNGLITSGIRFYFWTQSFGRLTGESTWKNNSDAFFFVHTFLWSFLPWSIIFIISFWKQVKKIVKQRFLLLENEEGLTIGGILFPFIAFSLSHYKLPHYIFVFFPLAAIISGNFMNKMIEENKYTRHFKSLRWIQSILSFILFILIMMLCAYAFPMTSILLWTVTFLLFICWAYFIFYKGDRFQRLLIPSFLMGILLNLLLNAHVYPELLNYQASSMASQKIMAAENPVLIGYQTESHGLDFYYRKNVENIDSITELKNKYAGKKIWAYALEEGYLDLENNGLVTQKQVLENYHITKLKGKFLNPKTRSTVTDKRYLLEITIPLQR